MGVMGMDDTKGLPRIQEQVPGLRLNTVWEQGPMTAEGARSGAVGTADVRPGYTGLATSFNPRKLVPGGMAYVVVARNIDIAHYNPEAGLVTGQQDVMQLGSANGYRFTRVKVCMTSGNIAVQVGHVIAKLAQESNWDVAESGIALLSVANTKDLVELAEALTNEGTVHVKYEDEGKLYGDGVKVFTALATHPIQKNASAALKKLRPWKCACNNDDRNERLGIREKASKPDDVSRPAGVVVSRDRDDLSPERIKAQDGRRNG